VETFGLLALDVRHRLRREAVISVGCLTSSLVHPREVFQEAIVSRAAALVLFHNHPSGDPEPSSEDVSLTRRLASAGVLMGIEILDHLVLGAGRYVSLKQRGVI
jgi:DNA repair protein RadC